MRSRSVAFILASANARLMATGCGWQSSGCMCFRALSIPHHIACMRVLALDRVDTTILCCTTVVSAVRPTAPSQDLPWISCCLITILLRILRPEDTIEQQESSAELSSARTRSSFSRRLDTRIFNGGRCISCELRFDSYRTGVCNSHGVYDSASLLRKALLRASELK